MNRREFNQLGTFAALSLAMPALRAEQFDYPWKLGVITDEADPDLARTLRDFYPKYDLKWAEIRNVKLDGKSQYVYKTATPAQLKEIKKQLDGANVKMSVLDTAFYKIALPGSNPLGENSSDLNPEKGEYGHQLEDLKRAADAGHALGTNRIRIFDFKRVADPDTVFDRKVEELNKALITARQLDIVLVLENEFSCNTATGTECGKILNAIRDPRFKLNWDPGNCLEAGEQPFPKAWDEFDHSRISHIHLKDAVPKHWKPIGGGEIDFVGQFTALKKMNYSGTLSLETHYKNEQHDPYTSSVESMDGLMKVLKQV